MRVRRFSPYAAVLGLLVATAGCGESSDGESADTQTGSPEQAELTLEALPRAEGRTAFAISDEAAIVGGGGLPQDDDTHTATYDVWMLGPDGQPSELPPLPADGTVLGLSGIQVDDTIVVGAMDCGPGWLGETVTCVLPRRPLLWTKRSSDTEWTQHPLPDDVVAGALRPDETIGSGGDVSILGAHDGRAIFSLTNDQLTRFVAFDPGDGTFAVLGDGPSTPATSSTTSFCLEETGSILHVWPQVQETPGAGVPLAEEVSVARLTMDGAWSEGPPLKLGDLESHHVVGLADIECRSGHDPLMSVPVIGQAPVLATVASDSLAISILEPATDGVAVSEVAAGGTARIAGVDPTGQVFIQATGGTASEGSLFTLGDNAALAAQADLGTGLGVGGSTSVFIYGNHIGNVNHRTGEVRVE